MTDYYSNTKPEPHKETLLDKLNRVETVGLMRLKGYTFKDIAEDQGMSPATAKAYYEEYVELLKNEVESNPDFMDKIQENTLRFLKEFDEITKEAWETVRIATDAGMVTARINALKLASENAAQKARLHQLLGGQVDSGYIARMQKAETVNQILSAILREIVAECDHCRPEAQIRLSEAFAIMGNDREALQIRPYGEIEEAVVVEDGAS